MSKPFSDAIITTAGAALLARVEAGQEAMEITRVVVGEGIYTPEEREPGSLKDRTALKIQRGSFTPSHVDIVSEDSIRIRALVSNVDPVTGDPLVTIGYFFNELGVYAKERDGASTTECLYCIAITSGDTGDYMPPYEGGGAAQIIQDVYLTVGNAATTYVDIAGAAFLAIDGQQLKTDFAGLIGEFADLNDDMAAFKTHIETVVGAPLVAQAAAEMTDTTRVYVYVGSETGYTSGNWYYYDGTSWVSGGVYNATAVNTDKTLTQEDQPADAKKTGDEITDLKQDLSDANTLVSGKVNKPVSSPDGVLGQLLRSLGNGRTEWTDFGSPTDAQVDSAVTDWLDEHPEATTSVADYSLGLNKFIKGSVGFVTPQLFDGKGDGETDDTKAIQDAIDFTTENGGTVYIPKGTYLVTSTLRLNDVSGFVMDGQAILKAGASMEYVVELRVRVSYLVQKPHIENINIDGNNLATNGVLVNSIVHTGTMSINGLTAKNCLSNGVAFNGCEGGLFFCIRAHDNGADGIRVDSCNNAKFFGLSSMANGNDGIVFVSTSGTSSGCYAYAVHSEQNNNYGIKVDAGLTSLYSGWLEGNKGYELYIGEHGRANIYGFRVIHSGTDNWCEINNKYVAIRDCEVQLGMGVSFEPLINSDYSIVENIFRATQSGVEAFGGIVSEKLLSNIIPNGEMQGPQSEGNFSIFYGTKEFQNTEVVDTGKTYSLKTVSSDGAMAFRKDGVSGFWPGILYKITFRCYLVGDDCKFRVYANDQTLSKTVYSKNQPIIGGQWNDVVGYFYAQSTGEIRIGGATIEQETSAGAIFYISQILVQPCVEKSKLSNKLIGKQKVYEIIEPDIM